MAPAHAISFRPGSTLTRMTVDSQEAPAQEIGGAAEDVSAQRSGDDETELDMTGFDAVTLCLGREGL